MLIGSINAAEAFIQAGINSTSVPIAMLFILLYAVLVSILMSVYAYVFGWVERKVIAKIQYRHGPTYVGKYGILQNLADFIKLITKEVRYPENADSILMPLSLVALVSVVVFIILILPLTPSLLATNMGLGLLLVFVILDFSPLLLFITGFASGNKFGELGAQRSVLMLISYSIPLTIVVGTVALAAHGFNIAGVISAQSSIPFILLMPVGFIVFFIAMLAELERSPFDLREADSELIAGWLTDVSGPYYALALMLDYTRMFMGSLLISILFLSGWYGPVFPPLVWLLIKAFIVSLFIILIRTAVVRMRIDKILRMGWIYLLPLSLLNLLITFMLFR
ncbi:MAG: NADH-quinone oxidoreductase subunit H [Candidatus Marsarchaeota archaeon]|jgi:NADH-quinone oxidoreductase subunit H|nr:NADH-quinone oxidoreductase subunit H [Candidatus Marsarchaeota archaeon]